MSIRPVKMYGIDNAGKGLEPWQKQITDKKISQNYVAKKNQRGNHSNTVLRLKLEFYAKQAWLQLQISLPSQKLPNYIKLAPNVPNWNLSIREIPGHQANKPSSFSLYRTAMRFLVPNTASNAKTQFCRNFGSHTFNTSLKSIPYVSCFPQSQYHFRRNPLPEQHD